MSYFADLVSTQLFGSNCISNLLTKNLLVLLVLLSSGVCGICHYFIIESHLIYLINLDFLIHIFICKNWGGYKCIHVHVCCTLNRFSRVQLFTTLWTAVYQAPLSIGIL